MSGIKKLIASLFGKGGESRTVAEKLSEGAKYTENGNSGNAGRNGEYVRVKKPSGPRHVEINPFEPFDRRDVDKWMERWTEAGNRPVADLKVDSDGYLYPAPPITGRPPGSIETENPFSAVKPKYSDKPPTLSRPNMSHNGVKPAATGPRPGPPPSQHRETPLIKKLQAPRIRINGNDYPIFSVNFAEDGSISCIAYYDRSGDVQTVFYHLPGVEGDFQQVKSFADIVTFEGDRDHGK